MLVSRSNCIALHSQAHIKCFIGPPRTLPATASRSSRAVPVRAQQDADSMLLDQKKELVANSIRGVPDFPKKGILFWDITTLCLDPAAFRCCIEAFEERYKDQKIDVIAGRCKYRCCSWCSTSGSVRLHCLSLRCYHAGFEARGFIFGPPLALALNCSFVPLRKPGKLPGASAALKISASDHETLYE